MANLVEGTRVSVSNGSSNLKDRIYLFTNEEGNYVCVHAADEAEYQAGAYFRVGLWSVLETENSNPDRFSYGDRVLVSNWGEVFRERTYLGKVGDRVLTVHAKDEDRFEEGKLNFRTALWNMARD